MVVMKIKRLEEVRAFRGNFKGKTVTPHDDIENMDRVNEFKENEMVWVLNASDFREFLLTFNKIRDTFKNGSSEDLEKLGKELVKK